MSTREGLFSSAPDGGAFGGALPAAPAASTFNSLSRTDRVAVSGKFFEVAGSKWFIKGFTYGPFAPRSDCEHLPERPQSRDDFKHIRELGANALRLYQPPPPDLLDDAAAHDLRVLIDVPWEKHRCFLEDKSAQQSALEAVRRTAAESGNHPAVFAVSVANEIPHDVVRYYGARRIERFLSDLIDAVKQEAPRCLVTYANYPSTEFLRPRGLDFYCANVYLDDPTVLGSYLDRLQHVAGSRPLVLGEYGVDTLRNGVDRQARLLGEHVAQVFGRGLAGSFVFSYTDDWFTGGYRINDWAFGVTTAQRTPKPAARALTSLWNQAPFVNPRPLPKVSVVVCSYNGGATLAECLASLLSLDYADHELILVDDGSTDDTPQIARRFPQVRYLRQQNLGLSAARNAGARAATGEIVAYTDADCVVDPHWLGYLVRAMLDQGVEAIGGPNLPPPSDNWTARCVAASPGGPSHVMIDDRSAEHIPGCNLAVRRDVLLAIGGFDEQFRQAGDDVDLCWRLLDSGMRIGYAPAAVVWHHRRSTVRAYLVQQKGYGRAEAMLQFKHPQRFTRLGRARWNGIIYGQEPCDATMPSGRVYHGRFGAALFQLIYPESGYRPLAVCTLLEWHVIATSIAAVSLLYRPILAVSLCMWAASLFAGAFWAYHARLPAAPPWWGRPLLFILYLLQPILRAGHRAVYRLSHKRLPTAFDNADAHRSAKPISPLTHDLYFSSDEGVGREHLLEVLADKARKAAWYGDFDAPWEIHDVELNGDLWHDLSLRSATENLGGAKRFTRVRCSLRPTTFNLALCVLASTLAIAGLLARAKVPLIVATTLCALIVVLAFRSRGRGRRAVSGLVLASGVAAGLHPVRLEASPSAKPTGPATQNVPRETFLPAPACPEPTST